MTSGRVLRCVCGTCKKLLAIRHGNGIITIKYKDLTAWVQGEYKTVCRYCGAINTFMSEQYKLNDVADQLNK